MTLRSFQSAAVAVALVLGATTAPAQSRVEVRGPKSVATGSSTALEVSLITPGFSVRKISDAEWSPSCGAVDAAGTFHAPSVAGRCTLRARVTGPDGRRVIGVIEIDVVEPPRPKMSPPPPTPPPTTTAPLPPPPGERPPPAASATLPQFPWPPPRATTRLAIPRRLLTGSSVATAQGDRLGDVADRIEDALRNAGLDHAVYAIGDSGFSYVTRVEMIGRDGRAVPPPDRFPSDARAAAPSHGFLDFIMSRFFARPGYYRVIAIVVTNRAVTSGTTSLTVDAATALANGGMATLPPVLRRQVVRDLTFAALVYEFGRPSAADTVAFRSAPLVPARDHLALAGLWNKTELAGSP